VIVSLGGLLLLACLAGMQAHAQYEGERSRRLYQSQQRSTPSEPSHRDRSSQRGIGLPSWAEPSPPAGKHRNGGVERQKDGVTTHNIGKPGTEVPVDGGLIWLILAGGGYAFVKLSRGQKEENEG
jgi:hypothetical protein